MYVEQNIWNKIGQITYSLVLTKYMYVEQNIWNKIGQITYSLVLTKHMYVEQNIWNKIEKFSKIGFSKIRQDKKSFMSTFAFFLTANAKV